MLAKAFDFRCTILYLPPFSNEGRSEISPLGHRLIQHAKQSQIPLLAVDWSRSNLRERGLAPAGFSNSEFNFGHLNSLGHKIVAEQLADHLRMKVSKNGLQ